MLTQSFSLTETNTFHQVGSNMKNGQTLELKSGQKVTENYINERTSRWKYTGT